MKKYALSLMMIITIIGISVVDISGPLRIFSAFENRFLSTKPTISIETIVNNEFSSAYERYVNDQFVAKDQWITLKSTFEKLINKQENNGIYFGKSGFLFEKILTESEQLKQNQQYMDEFLAMYSNLPISLVIPLSSSVVYHDKLPSFAPMFDQQNWYDQQQKKWPLIDVMASLSSSSELVYYRNDHHWSLYGAYLAYVKTAEEFNVQANSWESFTIESVADFLGSYYAKGKPLTYVSDTMQYINPSILSYQTPLGEYDSLMDFSKLGKFDKYSAFLYGNQGFASIKVQESETPKRLLVIKDSYANSMIPFLVSHYDEIDIIDLRHYSKSIKSVLESKPYDNILFVCSFSHFASDKSIAKLRY